MKRCVLPMITDEVQLPFYVCTVGGMENQNQVSRPNGYPYYVWLHTIRGTGKLTLDGTAYELGAATGMLLYPDSSYEYEATGEPWETHWVAFQGYAVEEFLKHRGLHRSGVFTLQNIQKLDHLVGDIFLSVLSHHPDSGLMSSGKLYSFLIELVQSINRERTHSNENAYSRLQPVIAYMENHLGGDLSLDGLASVIGTSPQYLCRMFKHVVQMSPMVYLTRIRLQKAKELLLESRELPIAEIAGRVGFQTASYFCAVFKQNEGMTPVEFRKSYS